MFARARRIAGFDSGHIATITVIVLAYVVTFGGYLIGRNSAGGPDFTFTAFLIALVLGIAYLVLSVWGLKALRPIFDRHTTTAYFVLLTVLVLAIEFILAGSNGIWLISMPLVATATVELPPWPRRLVYLLVLLGMVGPIYAANGVWQTAIFAGLTFSPAIIFVIVFVSLTDRAETAQARAEELAAQLADANVRLSAYAVQAEELATTQERNRLAREIHDSLGHFLTVANVQIKAAQATMDKDPVRAQQALEHAARLTQEGLAAVRQSVATLRETPLGGVSLPDALAALAAESQATGIVTELTVTGTPRPLDPRAELTLYRAAQEGLTNVRKHARASRIDIQLGYAKESAVELVIHDNGIGGRPAPDTSGFGLLGLAERARQLGGHLSVAGDRGDGYTLTLTLPWDASQAPRPDDARQGAPAVAGSPEPPPAHP